MPSRDDITWFKDNFGQKVGKAIAGTPFDIDMITAIACQETGEVWQRLRHDQAMTPARILQLCVGDTIDGNPEHPRNRAWLESAPNGKAMFQIARAALEDMAAHIPGYAATARNPNKFCHGYGIFQYDIQFFVNQTDQEYFLQKKYEDFDESLGKCVEELEAAQHTLRWQGKDALTDLEKAAIAIAYNTGHYNPMRGLKQGFEQDGKFYGENFYSFMLFSRGVEEKDIPAALVAAAAPFEMGDHTVISTSPLNLRAAPDIQAKSLATYKYGTRVNVLRRSGDWALVSVNLNNSADGYMWSDYLAAA